ncbi:PD-(D/E)XK motif protein [Bacillus sp. TH22]|uniref:PD-(D/E)XK motif protein n=1 Tax=unclassified Bacillus (in: firmicutes) TaxID=185979 RepID=UPI0019149B99|nr:MULTISPECIES: PD-(D/E)XK motif protein [unclassified Bacillus (in: firmicutes)]MBK5449114.1 PD-(D/E)XK motif protein [Bacillus sp. TH22]MBK5456952.1 PD-(D/E)XK motif protein [Bacillus sp. TH23]
MRASDYKDIFDLLSPSADKAEYTMKQIINNFFVGKNYLNNLCLLLRYSQGSFLQAGRSTKGILLEYFASEKLYLNGKGTRYDWAVITCLDPMLNSLFPVLAEGIRDRCVNNLMSDPRDILEYILEWQELLAFAPSLTEKQLQGLWGELSFILDTKSPEKAILVWEGPNKKKFDFSNNKVDIEVKTSLNRHIHTFSDEQLQTNLCSSSRYVYSLYLEEDLSGGKSISDLVNEIRSVLSRAELFERKLLAYGYRETSEQYEKKFSIKSTKLVKVSDIPKVHLKDLGVFDLKYQSDLTFCIDQTNKNEALLKLIQF